MAGGTNSSRFLKGQFIVIHLHAGETSIRGRVSRSLRARGRGGSRCCVIIAGRSAAVLIRGKELDLVGDDVKRAALGTILCLVGAGLNGADNGNLSSLGQVATLDLGGDVFVMGRKTDGSDWRIAVKDPADTESYLGVVSAADKFIVTSGVYERYFEENGVRYHHILDPKTGCPAESGLVSVTVLCENGAWADALSTACFVLGPDGALALRDDLADQGTDFELILVTDDGRVLYTDGLADAFTPNDESGYTYEALA